MQRRIFLKNSAMAMVGIGALPTWLAKSAWASTVSGRKKILVAVFQRGAADGLNVVVPYGEPAYYAGRPTIAIPRQEVVDLDGFFGLHPALGALQPLWREQQLAAIHAAGSPDPTRSHFDAQDYMESGTPGTKSTESGWLNRALGLDRHAGRSPLRAVAMGPQVALTLEGRAPAVAINNLSAFRLNGRGAAANALDADFEAMYDASSDAILRPAGADAFRALGMLKGLDAARYQPAAGANYPNAPIGQRLRQLAQLIKADVGVEVAFADVEGWDHHVAEGNTQGQLANSLRNLGDALAAFWLDLGPRQQEVLVITMSEFGRTVRENGSRGTDHGHANVMFALGGDVHGGKVYGDWPGLEEEKLYQGRDLAVTTDFRDVLSEAVEGHLGVADLGGVFPGFAADARRFRGFLRGRATMGA